jgi:hypothetical protein
VTDGVQRRVLNRTFRSTGVLYRYAELSAASGATARLPTSRRLIYGRRSTRIGPQDDARYTAAGWLHIVLSNGSFDVVECAVEDELEHLRAALDVPPSGIQ